MGHEQRAKEEMAKLGRFNVHIKIEFREDVINRNLNFGVEEYDCREWAHVNKYLVLTLENEMQVICLDSVKKFIVSPQQKVVIE